MPAPPVGCAAEELPAEPWAVPALPLAWPVDWPEFWPVPPAPVALPVD